MSSSPSSAAALSPPCPKPIQMDDTTTLTSRSSESVGRSLITVTAYDAILSSLASSPHPAPTSYSQINGRHGTTSSSTTIASRLGEKHKRVLILAGLIAILSLATILAVLFVPRDEHSPRAMLHPLAHVKRAAPQPLDSIRYLTFGSASTWGEGLEGPQQQAYPWLLSSTAHNVAARVGGLALSAICTQSIVGDDKVYDVIVVEFKDDDKDSVVQLSTRLRERFPFASLVFVRLWSPDTHIVYQSDVSTSTRIGLIDWWTQQQKQQHQPSQLTTNESAPTPSSILGTFEFQSAVLNSDPRRWSFVDHAEEQGLIEDAIHAVDGHLLSLPLLPQHPTSIPTLLTTPEVMGLFQANRPALLSPKGHQTVAQGIQRLVTEELVLERPRRHELGSWGSGDACNLWYATGDYSTLRKRRRASLVDFSREEDGVHKHAVEISRRGGSVDVTNPFSEPRMLYLTYMTATKTTATKDNAPREYPRTKISLDGKPTLLIDPIHDLEGSDDHLTRTTAVGLVAPGQTVLRLDSLDASSSSRFRLVGLHFLNQGKVPIPFEFDLEPDSAHR